MNQIVTLLHGGSIKIVLVTLALLGAMQFLRSAGGRRYQYAIPRFSGLMNSSGSRLLKGYEGDRKITLFLGDLQEFFPGVFSDDDLSIISGYLRGIPEGTILKMYSIPVTIHPEPDMYAGLVAPSQEFSVPMDYSPEVSRYELFRSAFGLPQEPFEFPFECLVEDYGRQRIVFARPKEGADNIMIAFILRTNSLNLAALAES